MLCGVVAQTLNHQQIPHHRRQGQRWRHGFLCPEAGLREASALVTGLAENDEASEQRGRHAKMRGDICRQSWARAAFTAVATPDERR